MSSLITIQYLYNSGFTISYKDTFLVIDYWKGDLVLPTDKKILFIVTHAHADHYNPAIFTMPGTENARYVLSNDVERIEKEGKCLVLSRSTAQTRIRKIVYDPQRTHRIGPNAVFRFGDIDFHTYGSTDQGISVLFTLHSVNFFHAGDLNAWKWPSFTEAEQKQEVRDYLRILEEVSLNPIDIGFGVLDPRLGENAMLGPSYYLKRLHPQIFIPMHFRDEPEISNAFYNRYQDHTESRIQTIQKSGDKIIVQG